MYRPALLATMAALAMAGEAQAQTEVRPPTDYALMNARIVVAPGRVIERGTVHIANGRIVAAGERVNVPATAIQLDLTGSTIYPGLIDAASTVGLPPVAPPGGGRGGRGGAPETPGGQQGRGGRPAPPPETRPEQLAADVFSPAEADLQAYRAAGVTTLGLAFDAAGIFPGQTAVASARSGDPAELILKTPVSLQVTFGRRRGGYPGTLMGAVAYIKQAFYDAEHDRRVAEAFQRNPAAAPRPSYDAEHRALAPALAGTLPVWFFGSTERDLERIVDIARELRIQNYTIVGAQEGWLATELLKQAGRPVIVSLDFPSANAITGRAFEGHVAPVSGPDAEGAEKDSAAVRAARGNAAALAGAGMTVALSGYGLDGPAEFREALLAAVEAGLSPDEALRALTVTPAQMLGLEGIVGTVEAGKLANLVVVQGDLFSRTGRIRRVFVEGERFEIREPEQRSGRGGRGGGGGAGEAVSLAGEWVGTMEGPNGPLAFTLTAQGQGQQVTGQLATEMGVAELRGELTGQDLSLRGVMRPPGQNAMNITLNVRITGDDMRGTLVAQGLADIPFVARRRDPGADADAALHGGVR
jgi:imidazolonepropionase-like amidohydrolase